MEARQLDVLSHMVNLRRLRAPGAQAVVDALTDHPALDRLSLAFGTASDLSALTTMPALRDLEIWQIQQLDDVALRPLVSIEHLRALSLGALRHVKRLDFIADHVQYVMLEKLPELESLAPLARLTRLRACSLYEARPADRSLRPLGVSDHLEDLFVSDVYPPEEVEALVQRLPGTRISIRARDYGQPSRVRWRGLFPYLDAHQSP